MFNGNANDLLIDLLHSHLRQSLFFVLKNIILADAQTSGGLLFSCKEEDSKEVLKNINKESHFKSKIIGHFIKPQDKNIICDWCQKFT